MAGGGGSGRLDKGQSGEDTNTIFRGRGGGATGHVGKINVTVLNKGLAYKSNSIGKEYSVSLASVQGWNTTALLYTCHQDTEEGQKERNKIIMTLSHIFNHNRWHEISYTSIMSRVLFEA